MSKQAETSIINNPWARPIQAAEYFQVTKMTLSRWEKKEGFPTPLRYAGTVRYNIPAIEQWMMKRKAS